MERLRKENNTGFEQKRNEVKESKQRQAAALVQKITQMVNMPENRSCTVGQFKQFLNQTRINEAEEREDETEGGEWEGVSTIYKWTMHKKIHPLGWKKVLEYNRMKTDTEEEIRTFGDMMNELYGDIAQWIKYKGIQSQHERVDLHTTDEDEPEEEDIERMPMECTSDNDDMFCDEEMQHDESPEELMEEVDSGCEG